MSVNSYFKAPVVEQTINTFFNENESLKNSFVQQDYNVAIIGIEEGINSLDNKGCLKAPDKIRQQLYALKGEFKNLHICDLGNIRTGSSVKDTYHAVKCIVAELSEKGIVSILLGGSQDITLPVFTGLKEYNHTLNAGIIDARIDTGKNDQDINSFSFIQNLLNDKTLRRLEIIACQSYFVPESQLDLLSKHNHAATRLGIVRNNISIMEPLLRDADMVSFDMGAIRQSDSPAYAFANPNGLLADEACQLSLYAGYSDRIKAFGLFEMNPDFDINNQSAGLAAQIIWHFLEGLNNRQNDYPKKHPELYQQYLIEHELIDENIVFYHNELNNRWWIEIPNRKGKKEMYACGMQEYQHAQTGKIPDMWLRFFKK